MVPLLCYSPLFCSANVVATVPWAGSVSFRLDGSLFSAESVAPYAMAGDFSGHYRALDLPLGTHVIEARAMSLPAGGGQVLSSFTRTVTVAQTTTAPKRSAAGTTPAESRHAVSWSALAGYATVVCVAASVIVWYRRRTVGTKSSVVGRAVDPTQSLPRSLSVDLSEVQKAYEERHEQQ